ncbi:MAG TPA: topoisomerase C-terminal repeat-containing protein, partial [Bacteroidia bacterium]
PRFAGLRRGQSIETLTFEEALDLFKLPRNLGKYNDEDVIVSIGRFGPYIKLKEEYISLPKTDDPYTITLDRVIEIITGPRLPKKVGQYEGQDVIAAKGFFGNYLKHGNTNASMPKQFDPFTITIEEAIPILITKIEKDKAKHIKSWEEDRRVKVVIGRWGKPCIQAGRKFVNIPKGKEPAELTLEECLILAGFKKEKKEKAKTKSKSKGKVEGKAKVKAKKKK